MRRKARAARPHRTDSIKAARAGRWLAPGSRGLHCSDSGINKNQMYSTLLERRSEPGGDGAAGPVGARAAEPVGPPSRSEPGDDGAAWPDGLIGVRRRRGRRAGRSPATMGQQGLSEPGDDRAPWPVGARRRWGRRGKGIYHTPYGETCKEARRRALLSCKRAFLRS